MWSMLCVVTFISMCSYISDILGFQRFRSLNFKSEYPKILCHNDTIAETGIISQKYTGEKVFCMKFRLT